jgi:glycosyltransferase involved in cell wall biosynthesis
LLGPVDHDRLPTLMAAAEVFAFPSVKEGFGLAAMESLAAGTPVVMRDLPVLREVFADTVAYTSDDVSLAGAIASSKRDPDVIARGRDFALTHTWTHAARSHVDFYEQLH